MKYFLLFIVLTMDLSTLAQPTVYNLPEGPYGGGRGYTAAIKNKSGYTIVSNFSQLVTAVNNTSIDKIYIADGATIEFVANNKLVINRPNLTIAGGRGVVPNPGRLSRVSKIPNQQRIIDINKTNVRITGLDIVGPGGLPPFPSNTNLSSYIFNGIKINNGANNVEIDNCLISGWTGSGVFVYGSNSNQNAKIHHNVIKDNNSTVWSTTSSFGYGISITGTDAMATIAYNLFENNKHAIAGSSKGGESYAAKYNVVIPNKWRVDHSFDMHGFFDQNPANSTCSPTASCNYAGESILIENNFFVKGSNNQEAIQIRGVPTSGAIINNNYFGTNIQNDDIVQLLKPVIPATPGQLGQPAVIRYLSYIGISTSNNKLNSNIRYLYTSSEAKDSWKLISPFAWNSNEIGVGDFHGDGKDDLFRAESGKWYISKSGSGNWRHSGTSGMKPSNIIFKDFNNDGITDLLTAWSGKWQLAAANGNGGFSGWQQKGTMGYGVKDVIAGDFNNDGWTDLMRTANGKWYRSFNSNGTFGSWVQFGTSAFTIDDFGVGDFDGNGYTDLLINDGGTWKVVYRTSLGWGNWVTVGLSSYSPEDMKFGDFDGDGDTDLFRSDGSHWYIAYSNGMSRSFTSWGNPVNISSAPFSSFFVGDFNGDGSTDINSILSKLKNFSQTSRQSFYSEESSEIINRTLLNNQSLIYPNPTTGLITLYRDNVDIPVYVEVLNSNGEMLIKSTESKLDISMYSPGLYFVKSYIGNDITIQKVIKE